MVTFKRAMLAEKFTVDAQGVADVQGKIQHRDEVDVDAVPTRFQAELAFKFECDEEFTFAVEVKNVMGNIVYYDSGGKVQPHPGGGEQETVIPYPIPVFEVGPMQVALILDGVRAWEQTVFFALKAHT